MTPPGASGRAPLDPLEYVLALTAFAAGSVDVISFTQLGNVFASAMTGNLALLAFYSVSGSAASAVASAIALFGFVGGAAAGTMLGKRGGRAAVPRLVGAELLLLLIAAALWLAGVNHMGLPGNDAVILMLAVAMGVQSISAKKINLSNIPSVVFTSTLANIVIGITDALAEGKPALPADTRRQLASFFLYFLGACSAGMLVFVQPLYVILLPLGAIAAALLIYAAKRGQA